jgi:hypothetical protein
MVELECPHCEDVIELDDGDYGQYSCPHCDDEFEYENEEDLLTGIATDQDGNHWGFNELSHLNDPMRDLGISMSIAPIFVLLSVVTATTTSSDYGTNIEHEGISWLLMALGLIAGVAIPIVGFLIGRKMIGMGGICGLVLMPFAWLLSCGLVG